MTAPDALGKGDEVDVIDGIKKGATGVIEARYGTGETGIPLWLVNLGRRGVRVVREDFMRRALRVTVGEEG